MAKNINDEIIDLIITGKTLSQIAEALKIKEAKIKKIRSDTAFQERIRERIPEFQQRKSYQELAFFRDKIKEIADLELNISAKLLRLIDRAVDEMKDAESPLIAIDNSRNLANLIKASVDMVDKAKSSASEVLGINEILANIKRPDDQYDQLSLDFGFWLDEQSC